MKEPYYVIEYHKHGFIMIETFETLHDAEKYYDEVNDVDSIAAEIVKLIKK